MPSNSPGGIPSSRNIGGHPASGSTSRFDYQLSRELAARSPFSRNVLHQRRDSSNLLEKTRKEYFTINCDFNRVRISGEIQIEGVNLNLPVGTIGDRKSKPSAQIGDGLNRQFSSCPPREGMRGYFSMKWVTTYEFRGTFLTDLSRSPDLCIDTSARCHGITAL